MPPKQKPETEKESVVEIKSDKDEPLEKKEEKCGYCLKSFSDQDSSVMCDLCDKWLHSRCQGVSEIMFKALSVHSKEVYWFCTECRQGTERLLPSISKIQTKVNKLEDETV